jgi:hypothetical protein
MRRRSERSTWREAPLPRPIPARAAVTHVLRVAAPRRRVPTWLRRAGPCAQLHLKRRIGKIGSGLPNVRSTDSGDAGRRIPASEVGKVGCSYVGFQAALPSDEASFIVRQALAALQGTRVGGRGHFVPRSLRSCRAGPDEGTGRPLHAFPNGRPQVVQPIPWRCARVFPSLAAPCWAATAAAPCFIRATRCRAEDVKRFGRLSHLASEERPED